MVCNGKNECEACLFTNLQLDDFWFKKSAIFKFLDKEIYDISRFESYRKVSSKAH